MALRTHTIYIYIYKSYIVPIHIYVNIYERCLYFPAQGSCGLPRCSRWSVCFVTCRGLCPVPCIVVRPLSRFSFLVTSLDLSVDLLLQPQYFGFWTSHFVLQPFHLAHHWSWVELVPSEPVLACLATCMSDPSAQAIQELTSAVQALTLAISGQNTSAQPSSADSSPGDWEVIGTESQDIRVARDTHCTSVRQRTAEEGPGEIPPILLDIARNKLTAKPPGADYRARRAFNAGFWALQLTPTFLTPLQSQFPSAGSNIGWFLLALLLVGRLDSLPGQTSDVPLKVIPGTVSTKLSPRRPSSRSFVLGLRPLFQL